MTIPPGGWFVHLVATYEDNSINKASVLLGSYKIAFWQDAVNRRIIVRISGNVCFVLFCFNFWGEGLAAIISPLDSRRKNIYGALKTRISQIGLFSSHWMFSCHCGAFLLKVMWSEEKLRVLRKRLKCEYFYQTSCLKKKKMQHPGDGHVTEEQMSIVPWGVIVWSLVVGLICCPVFH